ncbi:hypothetical protein, partial [Enterobacter intestinihominis]
PPPPPLFLIKRPPPLFKQNNFGRKVNFFIIERNANGVDGCALCVFFVASAHPVFACVGGRLGDAEKLDTIFSFLEVLVK